MVLLLPRCPGSARPAFDTRRRKSIEREPERLSRGRSGGGTASVPRRTAARFGCRAGLLCRVASVGRTGRANRGSFGGNASGTSFGPLPEARRCPAPAYSRRQTPIQSLRSDPGTADRVPRRLLL